MPGLVAMDVGEAASAPWFGFSIAGFGQSAQCGEAGEYIYPTFGVFLGVGNREHTGSSYAFLKT